MQNITKGLGVKTSNSLFVAVGFAATIGLVTWASFARQNISTESVFDAPTAEAFAQESIVEPAYQSAAQKVAQSTPSDPLERTVRVLSEGVKAMSASPQSAENDPVAKAGQAIARADAALAEAGLPVTPASPPPPDTTRSARLDALQARLDQLPR